MLSTCLLIFIETHYVEKWSRNLLEKTIVQKKSWFQNSAKRLKKINI